jgi:hypothetical protein
LGEVVIFGGYLIMRFLFRGAWYLEFPPLKITYVVILTPKKVPKRKNPSPFIIEPVRVRASLAGPFFRGP